MTGKAGEADPGKHRQKQQQQQMWGSRTAAGIPPQTQSVADAAAPARSLDTGVGIMANAITGGWVLLLLTLPPSECVSTTLASLKGGSSFKDQE